MCTTTGKSILFCLFSIVGTCFMFFLYAVFKSNPTMYETIKNPDKTCDGLLKAGIAYIVTAILSACFWFCHIKKDKSNVVVKETTFEENKKRFHFSSAQTDTTVPLLKAQL